MLLGAQRITSIRMVLSCLNITHILRFTLRSIRAVWYLIAFKYAIFYVQNVLDLDASHSSSLSLNEASLEKISLLTLLKCLSACLILFLSLPEALLPIYCQYIILKWESTTKGKTTYCLPRWNWDGTIVIHFIHSSIPRASHSG